MKKLKITFGRWEEAPAWDFGVPGVALFKRPDDNRASWNVIHLSSGLAIVMGEKKREDAMRAFNRFPPIDWTQERVEVLAELELAA